MPHLTAGRDDDRAFIVLHGLLVPGAFACAAIAAHASGFDGWLSARFFDPASRSFSAPHGWLLDLLGHRLAKSAILATWFALLAAASIASGVARLAPQRRWLWTSVAAMALGPLVVVALKEVTAPRCPWDLKSFGGGADAVTQWLAPGDAGRCFPGGHAAGGFSLIALGFAGRARGHRGLETAGVAAAFMAGFAFSAVRIAQGAHFLSHNLWSAAIDWWAAWIVFLPLLHRRSGGAALDVDSAPA
jgi:membrane-associated PAP2 superfamily phosphatase